MRWTLKAILTVCKWLRTHSLAGVHQLLKRLKIVRKRGRGHLHSPDPNYVEKLRQVRLKIGQVQCDPERQVILFTDELTFYRQPSISYDYARSGHDQPLAELGLRWNQSWRIAGALDVWTGQFTYAQHSHFTVKLLVDFYQQIARTYPLAKKIYLVMDNWPVHCHADVLAALADPTLAWPCKQPPNWPTEPTAKARRLNLPIRFLLLPSYAP